MSTSCAIGLLSRAITLPHWRNPTHLPEHQTSHSFLCPLAIFTISPAIWKCLQFPRLFENIQNIFGCLAIFLFRFHFNQICWFVVICDIDAFCKDQVSNTEPGFRRGVVQSLSSWPPPPPKDIWPLDKIVVSTKYLMQAKMRRSICREPLLIVRNVLFIIGRSRKSMATTWLCWVGSVQEELLLDSPSLAMGLDTYICKCSW